MQPAVVRQRPHRPFAWSIGRYVGLLLPLLMMIIGPVPDTAAAKSSPDLRSSTHVYFLRGVFNVFSLGLDEMAQKLNSQGIAASVHNHLAWALVAADAAEAYQSGRVPIIILVGHSQGATILPDLVERLDELHVEVKLAIGLDSIFKTSVAGNVDHYMNFYISGGAGEPVLASHEFHGVLDNIDVGDIPGIKHISIDKNEIVQQKVIDAIDRVVLGSIPAVTSIRR